VGPYRPSGSSALEKKSFKGGEKGKSEEKKEVKGVISFGIRRVPPACGGRTLVAGPGVKNVGVGGGLWKA